MEKSQSGAPIYRHKNLDRDFDFAVGDSENIDRITRHIEDHIGPVATVFHEVISDLVHVDIHIVAPRPERNCYTLVTSGMSDRAMQTPGEFAAFRYCELMLSLPPDWPMSQEAWKDEANYWPIRLLKFLARFPHEYRTWLWCMHTLPNGNPPRPFASNTAMNGVILLPPVTLPQAFHELVIDAEKTIHFHGVVPLHPDEMDLKLKEGAEALFDGFEKHDVSEILNPARASVIPKKRSWFRFK
jgi:hypothetical protein